MASEIALTSVPLAYSAAYLEPRRSFEYSTAVHTTDYSNFQFVKSDNAGLTLTTPILTGTPTVPATSSFLARSPILTAISTPEINTVEIKTAPAPFVTEHEISVSPLTLRSNEPLISGSVFEQPPSVVNIRAPATQIIAHTPIVDSQKQYTRQFVKTENVVVPNVHIATPITHVLRSSVPVAASTPIVHETVVQPIFHHTFEPIVHYAIQPTVEVKTIQEHPILAGK